MMAGSHVVVGVVTWVVTLRLGIHGAVEPIGVAAAALGSLLPDIDHPKSAVGSVLKPISVPLAMLLGHRGLTHSMLAVLGATLLLSHLGVNSVAAPLVLGYLSHLAADVLTPAGVPLLWPLKRRFAVPLCRTGGVGEFLVVGVIVAGGSWSLGWIGF